MGEIEARSRCNVNRHLEEKSNSLILCIILLLCPISYPADCRLALQSVMLCPLAILLCHWYDTRFWVGHKLAWQHLAAHAAM